MHLKACAFNAAMPRNRVVIRMNWTARFAVFIACALCVDVALAGASKIPLSPSGGYARESQNTAVPSPLDVAGSFTVEGWINPSDMAPHPVFSDSQYDVWTYQAG